MSFLIFDQHEMAEASKGINVQRSSPFNQMSRYMSRNNPFPAVEYATLRYFQRATISPAATGVAGIADEACTEVATRISVTSLDLPHIVSSLTEQPSPPYYSFTKDEDEWTTVERFQKIGSWTVRSYQLTALMSKFKSLKLRIQIIKSSNDKRDAAAALTKNVPNASTTTTLGTGITKTRLRGGGNGQLQSNSDPLSQKGVTSLDLFEQGGKYAFKLRQEDLSKGNRMTLDKEMETFVRNDKVRISAQGSGDLCMQGFFLPAAATCNCPFRHALTPHWSPAQRKRILQNVFKNSAKVGFYLSHAWKTAISRR